MSNNKDRYIDWATLTSIMGSVFAVLSILMAMFLFLASKMDTIRSDMDKEMKDFHGRLCAIEERNSK